MSAAGGVSIGVDIGGTFTDVVCRDRAGALRILKIPTNRSEPAQAVMEALQRLRREFDVNPESVERFVHGTTVATNAVIERKGARIGLLATAGFRDVLEIGRQMRHTLYDLSPAPETPTFLAPGRYRKAIPERIAADGEILVPLDEQAVRLAVDELSRDGVEAVAVCFLFSFLDPRHEERVREILAELAPELMVSISSEVDPAFREYERTAVTAFDAYLKPVIDRYLGGLETGLAREGVATPLQMMQSRGGVSAAAIARRRPVRLFLSGPAAGVIGARAVGASEGVDSIISLDVGGTSSDIAVVSRGKPLIRGEGRIAGYPVRVAMVDVNAIGAGGGSVAWLDAAGALHVGPRSAGSDPGPACYARGGDEATVTDASVVLGYLEPSYFAGGTVALDPDLAWRTIDERVATPMGISVEEAALGIHRVLNAQMAEGIRMVSIRQGFDPRQFTLLALGGAGPVHATALARELGIGRIVVPRIPGVLSAGGLLDAPVEHEVSAALGKALNSLGKREVASVLEQLDAQCTALMNHEQMTDVDRAVFHFADVCYVGQSHHLEVPLDLAAADPLGALYRGFLVAHERVYGHSAELPARIVNLRSVHQARYLGNANDTVYRPSGAEAHKRTAMIRLDGERHPVEAMVYDRAALDVGQSITGPAILEQADTTTVIGKGWRGTVSNQGNVVLETT